MSEIRIHDLDVMTDSSWSFRENAPRWQHRQHGSSEIFDPFPAYAHERPIVEKTVRHVQSCWQPAWDVDLYIANRESAGRSNGYSSLTDSGHYEGDEWVKDPTVGLIVLSGKRIPPHPAMTRYLVAHEYGHNVEWMLSIGRGAKHAHTGELINEYAEIRGLPESTRHHGAGGNWHDSATEVFACDFRILVCDVETEFWPHHGIPRPETVPAVQQWWANELARPALAAVA